MLFRSTDPERLFHQSGLRSWPTGQPNVVLLPNQSGVSDVTQVVGPLGQKGIFNVSNRATTVTSLILVLVAGGAAATLNTRSATPSASFGQVSDAQEAADPGALVTVINADGTQIAISQSQYQALVAAGQTVATIAPAAAVAPSDSTVATSTVSSDPTSTSEASTRRSNSVDSGPLTTTIVTTTSPKSASKIGRAHV